MQTAFQQQLNKELLRSEKRRIIILVGIILAGFFYQLLNLFFFKQREEAGIGVVSVETILVFPATIILFELFSLVYINIRFKKKEKKIPLLAQYFHVGMEICLLSFIIVTLSKQFPSFNALHSPGVFIYFIFIILSTLRLNLWLSVFSGLLSSTAYVSLCFFISHHFYATDSIKAIIIFFCGVIAGLVGKQIKSGINNSLEEAERRHRVENIFGQQISAEIADKMLENDGKLEPKRMKVAIMFIDIRNFTGFVVGKSPEEVVKYQNAFFSIVINTVTKYHGIVNQILGDGCMITFGAPMELQNPSHHAVAAAKELLKEIENNTRSGKLFQTRIGIGIHTGEVVCGNIGTTERQQYSITGSVVILASRIEQLNKAFKSQLLVSSDVMNSIEYSLPSEFMGDIYLKGWSDPVPVHKIA